MTAIYAHGCDEPNHATYSEALNVDERLRLLEWMKHPNGSFPVGHQLTFEAIGSGGIVVKMMSYRTRRAERW